MSETSEGGKEIERLMTVAEAARQLGVSADFIRRELSAGNISVYRIRGALRISPSDLREYLERHHQPSSETLEPKRSHF
jgi:excisionase family DNA binding protein